MYYITYLQRLQAMHILMHCKNTAFRVNEIPVLTDTCLQNGSRLIADNSDLLIDNYVPGYIVVRLINHSYCLSRTYYFQVRDHLQRKLAYL